MKIDKDSAEFRQALSEYLAEKGKQGGKIGGAKVTPKKLAHLAKMRAAKAKKAKDSK